MTGIVITISRLLTPDVIGALANACGLDRTSAAKAVGAAVPSILSGLVGAASTPGGAKQLANVVAEQPTNFLEDVGRSLTGSAHLAEKGASGLSTLLGTGAVGMLSSTLGKFLGIGEGAMGTLIGLLTPVIMGVLRREQQAAGLDGHGLARMLIGQKQEIANALPPGLREVLQERGLYEGVNSARATAERSGDIPRTELPRMMQRVIGDRKLPGTERSSWAYWVLPLLFLAGLLWFMLPRGHETVEPTRTSQAPIQTPTRVAIPERRPIFLSRSAVGWASMGRTVDSYVDQDVFNRAGEKLGTIKDVLVGPDGKIACAVINVGQFLAIGDKDIGVPFSALEFEQRDNNRRVVIDATKDALQAAPIFERH
jgi:hypothetical protein